MSPSTKIEHYYLIPNCIIPADSISVKPEWILLIETTIDNYSYE